MGFVVPGEAAVVFLIGQAPSGTINNLAGINFVAQANDPGFTGTVITGERFVSGTNDLFAPNGGFALPFPSSFQVFGANAGTGLTLTLSTAGATAGNYTVVLGSLLAVDPLFNAMPITAPVAETPEPGAIALCGAGLALLALRRRR